MSTLAYHVLKCPRAWIAFSFWFPSRRCLDSWRRASTTSVSCDTGTHHSRRYIGGQANWYNGEYLVTESAYGVISVVIQYRLGLFGVHDWHFRFHKLIFLLLRIPPRKRSEEEWETECWTLLVICVTSCTTKLTSDWTVVDQEFALKWVQKHVSGTPSVQVIM